MIFIDNKYTRLYYYIINQAKTRSNNEYVEVHHIIPKSLGGSNDTENLVGLIPREHYICHRLLPKMTEGIAKRKMSYAMWALCMNRHGKRHVPNNRVYDHIKQEYIKSLIGRTLTEETKEKIRNSNKGKVQSEETKRKRAEARTGIKNTEDTKKKMSLSAKKRWKDIDPAKEEIRKQKLREARAKQDTTQVKVVCPHCRKVGGKANMTRYHFNNCKFIKS